MTAPNRIFLARLAGIPVLDPNGDPVGKVRDVVTTLRVGGRPPRVLGLVIEILGRRRVFLPMTRVTTIDIAQVITTGLLNLRRFEQRSTETLVLGEMLDRQVTLVEDSTQVVVSDVGIEQLRTREWVITKVFVTRQGRGLRRRGESFAVDWNAVSDFALPEDGQGTANLLATFEALHAADLASILHELSPKRRAEVVAALDDDRLADVLEELPEEDQVEIVGKLAENRAADILEAMAPDDAADLLAELPPADAARLLDLMDPAEAASLRRLLTYSDDTAGGLMTTDPVILPPTATVAEALARIRVPEVSPAIATVVFVCRPPLEAPTGQFLGTVHIQRLLREPPSSLVSGALDSEIEPLRPEASLRTVTSYLATYNLVAVPIVDAEDCLLGVVTVDDVLDHLLPDDWREGIDASQSAATARHAAAHAPSGGTGGA